MTEPDVTLTDFALSLEGAGIAAILTARYGLTVATTPWLIYFLSAGAAAFFGGLVHGFYLDPSTDGRAVLWPLSLAAIGVNAVAACWLAANLVLPRQVSVTLKSFSVLVLAAYVVYVVAVDSRFVVAVAMAAPATLFFLVALSLVWWRGRTPGALIAAAGVALTLAAAAVQFFGIALDPLHFNHNATAHVVQAVSLALVAVGSFQMLGRMRMELKGN